MKRLLHLLVSGGLGAVLALSPQAAGAASAFVSVEQALGGTTNVLRRVGAELGTAFSTGAAPSVAGWRFVGWTVSSEPPSVLRDVWGRAFDGVSVKIYEETAFVAHYVAAAQDLDGDGLADGDELYWYGSLAPSPSSDTDGDGLSFAAELEGGTSPHFPDEEGGEADGRFAGGVVYDGRDGIAYNPRGYPVCTFRSHPEGALFATYSEVVAPGETLLSPVGSAEGGFACWQVDGVAQRDAFGRARDVLSLAQVTNDLEVVAVVESDARRRAALYWYGRADVALDSDTDGDGLTFAEELELGTNPLFPDAEDATGGVLSDGHDDVLYNPHGWRPYVVRADDGKLFAEYADYVAPGTHVTTPALDHEASDFAGWTVDGVAQRDAFGRARDAVSFEVSATGTVVIAHAEPAAAVRAALYWYGRSDVALDSDTDGDGATLAEEIAAGTNPLFADADLEGGVERDGLDDVELNQQAHERIFGFVVDGAVTRIGNEGRAIWPVVADVSGDGLWDLIVVSESATNVFVNVGTRGNPEFVARDSWFVARDVDLEMNSTAKLAALALDVAPVGALSATTNGAALLVSDTEGRVWYYVSTAIEGYREPSTAIESYALQHKVWGGSYAGFAQGLRLAAVDWDDDGDLDCLCGTADGKLMLLRDPKVGRPTGLRAEAGVDNVKLDWEPNAQSRVRGYRVYRAIDGNRLPSTAVESTAIDGTRLLSTADESTAIDGTRLLSTAAEFALCASTPLPTYRDEGLAPATYGYKVSALSRFYTAGNSAPTVTESVATDPVFATVGGPVITIGEPLRQADGSVIIVVSINNSMNYRAAGTSIAVPYDAQALAYQTTLASGLSEKLVWKATCDGGGQPPTNVVTIAISAGTVEPGAGTFFTLVFKGLSDGILMGDLDGDGDVDDADLRLLAKLKSAAGRKYTDYQLKAGDFNGNGKLDNADYQALREILKEAHKL